MPLKKKEKKESGEKSGWGSRLKSAFQKDKERPPTSALPPPPQQYPPPPSSSQSYQGPSRPHDGTFHEPSQGNFPYRSSPQPPYYGVPSQIQTRRQDFTYHNPPPPPPPPPGPGWQGHSPVYEFLPSGPLQNAYPPYASPPPQPGFRPVNARQLSPVPQFMVVPASEDRDVESDDESQEEMIALVPTNDGRYLAVNIGPAGRGFRAPSPSGIVSGRQGDQRVVYLDSDSESSAESLFRPPPPPNRTLEYDPRHEARSPRIIPTDRDDDGDESFNDTFRPSRSVSPEPGSPDAAREPNLNRRYDYLPQSMVPFWYIKNPVAVSETSRNYLCGTCRHIDLLALFKQEEANVMPKPREFIVLGTLISMASRKNCGLCSLVGGIIGFDCGLGLPSNLPEEERKEMQRSRLMDLLEESYYLCPIRFKTTFRTPLIYVCSGKEVAQMSRQSSVMRPRRSMAIRPVHHNAPNLGRLMRKPDQIDFEWIRERMRLCDERDIGRLQYTHPVNVRAIDVNSMRIVDLDHGTRYVTLSYVWGEARTLRLLKDTQTALRGGGLAARWDEIPKTIQDAIKLVRSIGEQYLWVDALCIIQDDDDDKKAQIQEMGTIYNNSLLTICVCCGADANYGLPGMEPGTRNTRQVAEIVGDFVVGNAMDDNEAMEGAKWDTRGWTMQEKCLSQRKLYINDNNVLWWCWHTITAEDENCRHTWWDPGTDHQGMFFFKTEHDLIVSKIPKNSNMDTYAFIVDDYTARDLKFQSDAERAVTGMMKSLAGMFDGKIILGLPDTELLAALLWCPVGASTRRVDEVTGAFVFPSWTWLGWKGHAAYPWLVERSMPMSEHGSPFELFNSSPQTENEHKPWFDGDMYRMSASSPLAPNRSRTETESWATDEADEWIWTRTRHWDNEPSRRWLHPVGSQWSNPYTMSIQSSSQLIFSTLATHFVLDSKIIKRKEKYDYTRDVHIIRVLESHGHCVGYIYAPPEESMSSLEQEQFAGGVKREFIILSRASTDPNPRNGEELLFATPLSELPSVYSMPAILGGLDRLRLTAAGTGDALSPDADEKAYFDTRLYDATMPWGLFNVMMIERKGDVAYRVAIGRIHVAAFMSESVSAEVISLE